MFVTEDRLLRDGARVHARRSLVSAESLPTSATFGQTPTCATHHRVPPPREVVIPWPEGRWICFSTNSSADVPPIFSSLRVLFSAQQLQPTPNQSVAHSLLKRKSLTHIFSMISTLRDHSPAPERKSTHLFSGACALFRKTHRGTPRNSSHNGTVNVLEHSVSPPELERVASHPTSVGFAQRGILRNDPDRDVRSRGNPRARRTL
jgi:hypothetical protein